jgi:hypothetical protein
MSPAGNMNTGGNMNMSNLNKPSNANMGNMNKGTTNTAKSNKNM